MGAETLPSVAPTHKLRWYQYSLRTLLMLMLLTSISMSCWIVVKRNLARVRLTDALKSPVTIDFVETPLSDVAKYLQGTHHITINIDEDALRAAGTTAKNMQVNMQARGISLQSALRLMLRQLGLTYVTRGNVLWITTPQQAAATGETAVTVKTGSVSFYRINEALKSPAAPLEFVETPLQDILEYLKDAHHIEIQLDKKSLREAGIEPDMPITFNTFRIVEVISKVKKAYRQYSLMSLQSGLRLLLRPRGLDYVVRDEVLMVTTAREAAAMNVPRRDFRTFAMVANEKRIADVLAAQTQVDVAAAPLVELALNEIRRRHKIEWQFDPSATKPAEADDQGRPIPAERVASLRAEDAELNDPGPPASNLPGTSLQSALQAKLDRLGLTFEIRDEVLLIVPKKSARQ